MFNKIIPQTVKAKLLAIIGFSFFLLVAGIVVSTAVEKRKSFMQGEKKQIKARYEQVQKIILDNSAEALSMALLVSEMPDVQRLFAAGDRPGLSAITLPMFTDLKKAVNIFQFQFLTPPATSFLRLHKPDKFGDDLSQIRHTIVQANQQKQTVMGLEAGALGTGMRGVAPVYFEGRHVGAVEFGKDLNDDMVKPLKEKFGIDVSVIIPDKNGFVFLARTHSMELPEARFPFLRKIMDQDTVVFDQVHKNGKDLLTAYGPLKDFSGKTIGVLAIPSDITATVAAINANLYKLLAGGVIFLLILLFLLNCTINRLMNKPLRLVIDHFEQAGRGDLTQRMANKGGRDEFAELGAGFNTFMGNVQGMVLELQDSVQAMAASSGELSVLAKGMEDGAKVSSGRANSVAAATEEMSANMNSVAAASEQAATNVNMVATATEEMSSTITKIAANTEKASAITREAVDQARQASDRVNVLGKAASEISKVTEVISEISEQTNLLALNATIEAARAGEVGKGFAVVANEIKDLAKQTSGATQQIKQQIEGIQASTGETIAEIREISGIIDQVNEIVTSIAVAIEEQAATTGEIGGNVVQAAQGITEVNENVAQTSAVSGDIASDITGVSGVIQEMSQSAGEVNNRAGDLAALAEKLRELISRFKA